MKKKRFDCVEMAHRARSSIVKKTAGMTVEEQVAFWHGEALKQHKKGKPASPRKHKAVHA